jgi:mannose-6-phosphate isomerase-like protein (cupin superfamily)
MLPKVNLVEKLDSFSDHWCPKVVGQVNDHLVKLVKIHGDFVWHSHEEEDEMFLVLRGRFRMDYRDRSDWIDAGEFVIVPRGVEHKPYAREEAEIMLFEPGTTVNTGESGGDRTVLELERI